MRDGNNAPIGQYFCDGEGKRVKKFITATGETTIFVYSNGKLVAEYSNNIAGPSEAKIAYTTTDHLGSPRVITDDIGQVRSRRDFLPFGEGVNVGIGGRTGESGQGYSVPTDGVRQKFTGYQKDTETSLDFAEARMYENRFGRFTAVDPLLASGKSANPQSFNRYVYVENRPLSLSDPSGQCPIGECPTAYSGTVYFKNIDGRGLVYNNEQEDESWKVFEGDTVIWRDDNRGYARINQFGWYGMNTGEVLSYMANNLNSSSTAIAGFGRDLTFFDQTRLTFTAMGKSSYNAVADFDNLFYSTAEKLSLFSPVNLPRVERWQPVNTFESKQMQATDLALLGISIYSSAGAVSAARTASVSGATSSTAVQFEQYALTARRSGLYPVMQRGSKDPVGTVFLNKGDVWKYGQTMNPASRYSGAFLKNTGSGLRFESQFSTTSYKTVLQMELQKITQYEIRFGQLPAGNKIRR